MNKTTYFTFDEDSNTYTKIPNLKINLDEMKKDPDMGIVAFMYASMEPFKEYTEDEFTELYKNSELNYTLSTMVDKGLVVMSFNENNEAVYSVRAEQ
jgi:hypothetical protein